MELSIVWSAGKPVWCWNFMCGWYFWFSQAFLSSTAIDKHCFDNHGRRDSHKLSANELNIHDGFMHNRSLVVHMQVKEKLMKQQHIQFENYAHLLLSNFILAWEPTVCGSNCCFHCLLYTLQYGSKTASNRYHRCSNTIAEWDNQCWSKLSKNYVLVL